MQEQADLELLDDRLNKVGSGFDEAGGSPSESGKIIANGELSEASSAPASTMVSVDQLLEKQDEIEAL